MTQPRLKKDKHKDAARLLAVQDLQLLLGAEPHLANGFRLLAKRAKSDELRPSAKRGLLTRCDAWIGSKRRLRTLMLLSSQDDHPVWTVSLGTPGGPPPGPRARRPTSLSSLPSNGSRTSVWQSIRPSIGIFALLVLQKLDASWSPQQ